jgi:hypothetical protein
MHILEKPTYSSFTIRDNFERINLSVQDEVHEKNMPILRPNWVELQAEYHAYLTMCEIEERFVLRNERKKKWLNVFTSL